MNWVMYVNYVVCYLEHIWENILYENLISVHIWAKKTSISLYKPQIRDGKDRDRTIGHRDRISLQGREKIYFLSSIIKISILGKDWVCLLGALKDWGFLNLGSLNICKQINLVYKQGKILNPSVIDCMISTQ